MLNIKSLRYRLFKIRLRVSHTGLLLWWHFYTPKRDAERNKLWLVIWHVGQTALWAGLDQWRLSSIPDLQPSVWRSGYARLTQMRRLKRLTNQFSFRLILHRFSLWGITWWTNDSNHLGYVCNHGSLNRERDAAVTSLHGNSLWCDECLKLCTIPPILLAK